MISFTCPPPRTANGGYQLFVAGYEFLFTTPKNAGGKTGRTRVRTDWIIVDKNTVRELELLYFRNVVFRKTLTR